MSEKDFKVLGHKKQLTFLKKAVLSGKLPHAMLFAGSEGIGKKKVAIFLAALMLCENKEACMECRNCRRVISGMHPNIMIISPQKETIKIDQIREAQRWLSLKPMEKGVKILIIDDAHKMQRESANAFLKTLEEPPDINKIILIASSTAFIAPTILSRCHIIRFSLLSKEDILQISKLNAFSQEITELALLTGSFRFCNLNDEEIRFALDTAFTVMNKPSIKLISISDKFSKRRDLFEVFLFGLRRELNRNLIKDAGLSDFHEFVTFIEEIFYNYNVNPKSLFEDILIKRWQHEKGSKDRYSMGFG